MDRKVLAEPGARQPIAKATRLLAWMVDSSAEQWGVREIARGMGLSPTTTHRLLSSLVEEGFVTLDDASSRYELGAEFFRVALKSTARMTINRAAQPYLEELVATCDETAFLSAYDRRRRQAMFVASVESSQALRYVVRLYEWMPIPFGASGLAILAYLPDDERDAVFDDVLSHPEPALRRTTLERELDVIRTKGYAQTRGQRVPGAVGIAAPIFASNGRVLGDVGLSIPEQRFPANDDGRLATSVMDCARAITAQLSSLVHTADGHAADVDPRRHTEHSVRQTT